jgi:hypothetical protein
MASIFEPCNPRLGPGLNAWPDPCRTNPPPNGASSAAPFSSSVAGVLNATTPLWTLVIAFATGHERRISGGRGGRSREMTPAAADHPSGAGDRVRRFSVAP